MPYAGHGVPCRWRKYGQMSRYENLSAFLFSFPLNMKHFSAWQVFRLVSLPNFLPAPEGQWIKCCPVSYRDTRQWICPGFTPDSLFIPEVRMYTGTPLAFMFTNIQNRMIYAIILTRKIHGRGRKKKGGGITREIFLPCMECLEILHEGIMKKSDSGMNGVALCGPFCCFSAIIRRLQQAGYG